MRLLSLTLVLLVTLLLSACGGNEQDLRDWVAKVEAKPVPPVRPLPDVIPYKAFEFAAGDLRSPFMKVVPESEGQLANLQGCSINDPQPDLNRRKEELEKMPIQTLSLVGTLAQAGVRWGIIRDESTGLIFRVKKGNHLGLNNGKITKLTETGLKLLEIVPNGRGCWESRSVSLELGQ